VLTLTIIATGRKFQNFGTYFYDENIIYTVYAFVKYYWDAQRVCVRVRGGPAGGAADAVSLQRLLSRARAKQGARSVYLDN
jgi:hypothetical protein